MIKVHKKKTRPECEALGGELFDIREQNFITENQQYKDAKNIWYLLAVIAGYHGADVDAGIAGPFDRAHAKKLLDNLLDVDNPESKDVIREICIRMHKQICGRCSCG